jgi:hypothetical protein
MDPLAKARSAGIGRLAIFVAVAGLSADVVDAKQGFFAVFMGGAALTVCCRLL